MRNEGPENVVLSKISRLGQRGSFGVDCGLGTRRRSFSGPSRILGAALTAALALALGPAGAVPPGGPDPSFTWSPGMPARGQDATFTISANDPDGVIVSATLDFGDGTRATVSPPRSLAKDAAACVFGDSLVTTVRHQFARTGDFHVRLTVVSGSCPLTGPLQEASASITKTVNVVERAAGPQDPPQQPPAPALGLNL